MLSFYSGRNRTCQGTSRREAMRIGGLSALGINLASWNAQQAKAAPAERKDVNCILFWMLGGPSQIETWDVKPEAPVEVRGEFQSIATSQPGFRVCELMPRLAQCVEKYSVIRSMTSPLSGHETGHYFVNAGRPKSPALVPAGYGAQLMYQRESLPGVPGFLQLGAGYRPQVGKAGYLGRQYDPLVIKEDPNRGNIDVGAYALPDSIDTNHFGARRSLLQQLDAFQREAEHQNSLSIAHDGFRERACSMVTSPKTKRACDLTQESDTMRDAYGRNRVGQRLLLARRLVEAGVRFVRVMGYASSGYDTHFKHFERMRQEVPMYDQGYATLLDDLQQRGMLDNTLVVTVGEFGRTPYINKERGGRDHWSKCFSLSLAGGGLNHGAIIGSSDKIGAQPRSRRLTVPDLAATIYHALGMNPHSEFIGKDGRPIMALPEGQPIRELV